MKTAEEVAEIILGAVWNNQQSREWHKERTIKALTIYATESYHQGVNHTGCKNTRAEALEEAALIVDRHERGIELCADGVAERIRSMEP